MKHFDDIGGAIQLSTTNEKLSVKPNIEKNRIPEHSLYVCILYMYIIFNLRLFVFISYRPNNENRLSSENAEQGSNGQLHFSQRRFVFCFAFLLWSSMTVISEVWAIRPNLIPFVLFIVWIWDAYNKVWCDSFACWTDTYVQTSPTYFIDRYVRLFFCCCLSIFIRIDFCSLLIGLSIPLHVFFFNFTCDECAIFNSVQSIFIIVNSCISCCF